MARWASRLKAWATNPHQIACRLLAVAIGLQTLTILPPSSDNYLVRVDSLSSGGASVFTTWFSARGFCTRSVEDGNLSSGINSHIRCSVPSQFGYDLSSALSRNTNPTNPSTSNPSSSPSPILNIPDLDIWSPILTRPPFILSIVILVLSFCSILSHQRILYQDRQQQNQQQHQQDGKRKPPRAIYFAVSLVCGVLANVLSSVDLGFELLLESVLLSGSSAVVGSENHPPNSPSSPLSNPSSSSASASFAVSVGPLGYAVRLACVLQLLASAVSFYTCIGGKYRCESQDENENENDSESESGNLIDAEIGNLGRGYDDDDDEEELEEEEEAETVREGEREIKEGRRISLRRDDAVVDSRESMVSDEKAPLMA